MPMKPWDKQKQIQVSKERVASIEEVIELGLGIKDEKIRALFFITYLTGARICEVVRKYKFDIIQKPAPLEDYDVMISGKNIKRYMKKRVYDDDGNPIIERGMRRKDITFLNRDGRKIMLIFLRNEKNQKKLTKDIPIPLDRQETITIYNSIIDYITSIEMNDELFPFGYQYAYRKIKGYFNPHWLRHLRATHLTVNYGFTETELKIYLGWTDTRPAAHYIEMKWADLLNKL